MNKILPLLVLLAGAAFFSSCVRKCTGCQRGKISFTGFDSASLEQVIIKQYSAGSGFGDLTDSVTIFLSKSTVPIRYYDTVNKFVEWTPPIGSWPARQHGFLSSGYEYEIAVPNAGKVFRIRDIVCSDAKSACSGGTSGASACVCTNSLEFYRLNDVEVYTGSSGAQYCSSCNPIIKLQR
jgi:hypothetical protein